MQKIPTSTKVTASADPAAIGSAVTYVATVSPSPDGGTVTFTDGGVTIAGCASVPVNLATGKAKCQTSYGAKGDHTIKATYSSDTTFAWSSGTLAEKVAR